MSILGNQGTSDPRGSEAHSKNITEWAVATDDVLATEEKSSVTNELVKISEKIGELSQRPQRWNTQIRDLGCLDFHLAEPILIVIEDYASEGSVLARFPEVEAFGEGETEPEAILRLKEDIVRLFVDLNSSHPDELGPMPEVWLRVLRQVIIKD